MQDHDTYVLAQDRRAEKRMEVKARAEITRRAIRYRSDRKEVPAALRRARRGARGK